MQRIITHLWFDDQAEEAAKFYVSVFKNSRILQTAYYTQSSAKVAGRPEGSVMTVTFELEGQRFIALNGGPAFTLSPAVSLFVSCKTQEEIDALWEKLSEGGQVVECGWLTDKFGLSWQIVPAELEKLLHDHDPEASERVMSALLRMKKLDIAALKKAYAGK